MVSVEPSDAKSSLAEKTKNLVLQPILFIQALPYVTAQLSAYGIRFIRRPVVWMALVAHGLLLLLPAIDLTTSTQEEILESEPEEAPVIEVQNLSELIGSEPEELLPPPEPEAPPPPEQPVAAAPPEDVIITDTEDIPDDLPPEEPTDDSSFDESPPEDTPPDDQPFDRSGAQQRASDRTRTLGETTPPAPLLLDEAQQEFFFDMNEGNKLEAPLASGLTDLIVFNDTTLAEKEQAILDSFISGGDTPVPAGDYGGWPLYQLVDTTTNEEVGYLSVFQGSGGRTVLVGIWDSSPQ